MSIRRPRALPRYIDSKAIRGTVIFRPFNETFAYFIRIKNKDYPEIMAAAAEACDMDNPLSAVSRMNSFNASFPHDYPPELTCVFARVPKGMLTTPSLIHITTCYDTVGKLVQIFFCHFRDRLGLC